MTTLRFALTAAALVTVAAFATAEDKKKIDNPEYASWAKFKPGSSFKVKTTSEAGGVKSEFVMTQKLVELKDDKAVVEVESTVLVSGMEIKSPAQKRDVPKTVEVPAVDPKGDKGGVKPAGSTEEGTETVKVGGTEYKCKWFKSKIELMGMTTESTMWTSEDLPSGVIVKGTSKGPAGEVKMELIEVIKK